MTAMPERVECDNYDSEPVRYCAKCHSLKILYDAGVDSDFCGNCGSLEVVEAPFEVWEQEYQRRFGHKYAVKNDDPTKSFLFSLTLEELKEKVYKYDRWKDIIKTMYPHFPDGLGKADSVILFFHHIIKDNKIKELKHLLLKHFKY